MLFDPELFDPPLFDDEPAVAVPPTPIFTVGRDDNLTPYTFTSPIKDPDAVARPGMDWGHWLQEGDAITAYTVFADQEPILIDQVSHIAGVVSWRMRAGLAGEDYIVTCRVTTTSGLIDDRSIRVPVRQR